MKADKKMRKKKKFNLKKYCEPPPILNQWQCLVLRQHRERLRNAEPIVDTKPPILNRFMYYKPKVLLEKERNLQIIMAENKELLKRINIINRTTGEVDSHWRIRLQAMSNYETREREMKRITMDNYKFLQRILDTGPAVVDNVTLRKEWKKNLKTMSEMSRFPLVYICEKEGLLGDVIIPPRMRLKCRENRPKCFLDIGLPKTNRYLGRMIIELYNDFVPMTCTNFLELCQGTEDGLTYKNCPFHSIIPGIMCQGGDITKFSGMGGMSIYGEVFPDENFILQHNTAGVLCMENTGNNSNNSQFNITFKRLLCLNRKNVVFGKVIWGLNVLYMIEELGARSGKPLAKVVITNCGQYFGKI